MTTPSRSDPPIRVIPMERYQGESVLGAEVRQAQLGYYSSGAWFYRVATIVIILLVCLAMLLCLISILAPILLSELFRQFIEGMGIGT